MRTLRRVKKKERGYVSQAEIVSAAKAAGMSEEEGLALFKSLDRDGSSLCVANKTDKCHFFLLNPFIAWNTSVNHRQGIACLIGMR